MAAKRSRTPKSHGMDGQWMITAEFAQRRVTELECALIRIRDLAEDPKPCRMYVLQVAKDALAGQPLRPIRKETP